MSLSLTTDMKVALTGHFLYAWASPKEWVRILVVPPVTLSEGMHDGKAWLYISSGAAIPIAIQARYAMCPWCLLPENGQRLKNPEMRKVEDRELTCVDQTPSDIRTCFVPVSGLPVRFDVKNSSYAEFGGFTSWNGRQFPKIIESDGKGSNNSKLSAALEMLGSLSDAKLPADTFAAPVGSRAWDFCEPPDVPIEPRLIHSHMPTLPSSIPRPADITVTIHGIVDTDGMLHDAVISPTGWPVMDQEVLKVIQDWRFTPAKCNGRPIPTYSVSTTVEVTTQ